MYVRDVYNNPISNAHVVVKNKTDAVVFDGYTDANGYVKWINVTEYVENRTRKIFHTPHNITVSKDGYKEGYIDVEVNESRYVSVCLEPLYTVRMVGGWNCIALIGDEDGDPDTPTSLMASDLCESIETVGGIVYEVFMLGTDYDWLYVRRNGSTGDLVGTNGIGDFTLNNSVSYLIRVEEAVVWPFPWVPFTEQPDWYIHGGWNAINCARTKYTTSTEILNNYTYIDAVGNWTGENLDTDEGSNPFTLRGHAGGLYEQYWNANGIFVRSTDYNNIHFIDGSSHDYA